MKSPKIKKQAAASGREALSGILRRLAKHGVLLPEAQDVVAYLAEHSQLTRLLPNIAAQVRQAFGPQVELTLELYKDPEIVRKEHYKSDILDRLQQIELEFAKGYRN
jgi:hypothetical protein